MSHFNILYVHGLGSNSQSTTAQQLKTHLPFVLNENFDFFSPDIPELPLKAIPFIEAFVKQNQIDLVIGSSLGGFKVINAQFDRHVKVLVINPVVDFNATNIEISKPLEELYNQGVIIFEKHKSNNHSTPGASKLVVIIGDSDDVLLSNKQLEALKAFYLNTCSAPELINLPNEGHKLSEDVIRSVVCPAIANLLH